MFIAGAYSIGPARFGRVGLNIESDTHDLFHPSRTAPSCLVIEVYKHRTPTGVKKLFVAQRYQRINSRCSTCRPVTSEQRNQNQQEGDTAEDRRILGTDAV